MANVRSPSRDLPGERAPIPELAPEPSDREAFARAFVAARYLLGVRGPELLRPLEAQNESTPAESVLEVAARLGHSDQRTRAQALAAELLRMTTALDRWSLR